jgi:hypothetical protein
LLHRNLPIARPLIAMQSSTRIKLLGETDIPKPSMPSAKCDVFKRLEENKTVLHLLCALNRAHELSDALHTLPKEQAVLALAQVPLRCHSIARRQQTAR